MTPEPPAPLALAFDEARTRVLAAVTPRTAVRELLARSCGRALRADLVAAHPLPPFDNAAMDGWAVRSADLAGASPAAPVMLPVVAVIPAGRVAPRPLQAGEAMRLMTGAAMPGGADAVVPFEDAERATLAGAESVRATRPTRAGEHVRPAGADVAEGTRVLSAGRELTPHDLALAASLGAAELAVGPLPRVAVFTTGDELLEPHEPLRPGAIRDGNRPQLEALLAGTPATLVRSERLPDDAARIEARLRDVLAVADVVITVGGVSAGDFDPVQHAWLAIGGMERWRVAMRPGRPQMFGTPEGRLAFGLPGNPGSAACVFEAFVRPALRRWQGFSALEQPRVPVRAAAAIVSRAGRTDLVRCALAWRDGALWATPAGAQVSGHLAPQSRMDALLVVPAAAEALREGDPAEALVLRLPGPA